MHLTPARLLFSAALALAGVPPVSVHAQAASDEIRLRPGDAISVRVWRKPELSGDFVIAADGSVGDPFYADVKVSGLGVDEARRRIRDHVARIEADPMVWVDAVARVVVVGEVRQPGLLAIRYPTTLAQAIGQAGGATEAARLDRVQLVRDGAVQLIDLRNPASAGARAPLLSGDEIVVPRRSTAFRDAMVPISALASIASLIVTITNR
jgi:polysaccharide biosynthesis/export protein